MMMNQSIAFLGAGPMAEAILSGLINKQIIPAHQIYIKNHSNTDRLFDLQKKYNIQIGSLDIEKIDIIILAMQPKHLEQALQSIKNEISANHLIISIVTSVNTGYIENYLGGNPQIIRVMPNTPSMVGESATALSAGTYTSNDSVGLAMEIFRGIGEAYQIDEKQMDIFTGIAGSAPAYFYALMERMQQIAVEEGLPKTTARFAIAQTVLGAAKMVLEQEESFAELIQNVAAPNGPTAKGLKALKIFGGNQAIKEAVKATAERSKEMGEPFNKVPSLNK